MEACNEQYRIKCNRTVTGRPTVLLRCDSASQTVVNELFCNGFDMATAK